MHAWCPKRGPKPEGDSPNEEEGGERLSSDAMSSDCLKLHKPHQATQLRQRDAHDVVTMSVILLNNVLCLLVQPVLSRWEQTKPHCCVHLAQRVVVLKGFGKSMKKDTCSCGEQVSNETSSIKYLSIG